MPRENRNQRVVRLTRSRRRDPVFEAMVVLQERIRVLERQVRQAERGRDVLGQELQRVRATYLTLRQETQTHVLYEENRDLTLRVYNLQNQVDNMGALLLRMGVVVPNPFERSFSSFDFA